MPYDLCHSEKILLRGIRLGQGRWQKTGQVRTRKGMWEKERQGKRQRSMYCVTWYQCSANIHEEPKQRPRGSLCFQESLVENLALRFLQRACCNSSPSPGSRTESLLGQCPRTVRGASLAFSTLLTAYEMNCGVEDKQKK